MISLNDLRLVNTKVNLLPYKSDAERFGTPEFWVLLDEGGGDCEDFSIAKYRRLLADGVRPAQMRFATCFVERSFAPEKRNRYHCVLLVDLSNDTYVLDNRYPHPMDWAVLPYEWHKIQIPGTQTWEWATNADRSFG